MPFKPGNPGRPKGSLNKRTLDFLVVLQESGFCPATAMVDIYKIAMEKFLEESEKEKISVKGSFVESDAPKYLKIAADQANGLAGYAYPKLKAIDQVKNDPLEGMTPQQRLEAMKSAVAMLELELKRGQSD